MATRDPAYWPSVLRALSDNVGEWAVVATYGPERPGSVARSLAANLRRRAIARSIDYEAEACVRSIVRGSSYETRVYARMVSYGGGAEGVQPAPLTWQDPPPELHRVWGPVVAALYARPEQWARVMNVSTWNAASGKRQQLDRVGGDDIQVALRREGPGISVYARVLTGDAPWHLADGDPMLLTWAEPGEQHSGPQPAARPTSSGSS